MTDNMDEAARDCADHAAKLARENARLRDALELFSIFAGVVFARNYNKHDTIVAFQGEYGKVKLLAVAFLDARAALNTEAGHE